MAIPINLTPSNEYYVITAKSLKAFTMLAVCHRYTNPLGGEGGDLQLVIKLLFPKQSKL